MEPIELSSDDEELSSDDEDDGASTDLSKEDRFALLTKLINASMPLTLPDKLSETTRKYLLAGDRETMLFELQSLCERHLGLPLPPFHAHLTAFVDFISNNNNLISKRLVVSIQATLSSANLHASSFVRLLDPKLWIDDDAINAYGGLLESKFNIAYIPQYVWNGKFMNHFDRIFSKKYETFFKSVEFIFCPFNFSSHWVLLVAQPSTAKLNLFNSYSSKWNELLESSPVITTAMAEFRKRLEQAYPSRSWSRVVQKKSFPTQYDWQNCGVYVMYAMYCLAANNFETAFEYKSWDEKAAFLRLSMACSLLTQTFQPIISAGDEYSEEEVL